jgi:Flp pilus assembly protein TadD
MLKSIRLFSLLLAVVLLALAGSGCTARMRASYFQQRAEQFFKAGNYASAEIEYKNVIRNAPQNAEAWSRLGTIYYYQGRLPEAATILTKAEQLAPNDLDVRLNLGTIYKGMGMLKEARDEAEYVLDRRPQDDLAPILLVGTMTATNGAAEIRLRLQSLRQNSDDASLEVAWGTLALMQKDVKSAEACYNRALELDPKCSHAYNALGALHLSQMNAQLAVVEFQKAAELAPPWFGDGVRYAQFKEGTGDAAAGEKLLQDITTKAPYYLPAWMALAQLAAAKNDFTNALDLVGNVLSRDPKNFEGLILQGRLELAEGRTDQAITSFERMTTMFPKAPVARYQLAQAYLANHQTNEANNCLVQALSLNPKYANATMALAEIRLHTGKAATAMASLEQLIRQQPQFPDAWLLLAETYRSQANLDGAVQIYRELEIAYPKNVEVLLLLGKTLLVQKKDDEARVEFDQALKLAPDYLPALEQVVHLDLVEKQYDTAQRRVQQRIGQYPKSAPLQLLLAGVLVARGDTNQAESTLQKAIELQPDSPQAYRLLAQLYIAANQNQQALADLKTALARNQGDIATLMLLGMTCEAEKNYPDAREAYEKVLTLTPNDALALNNLACLYAEHLGQLDKGYQLARKAREQAPTDPAVADTLGWILYRQGQYASALNLLRESSARLDAPPEVQFHLGVTYYMMGDEANARSVFQRALQLNKDFPEKHECKQCLAVLAVDTRSAGADVRGWLEKWVAGHPNDPVALMRLAAIDDRAGMADQAVSNYEAALKAAPQNVEAMVNLARLYAPRDPQKAFALAKAAYGLTPNDPLVAHTLARLAFLTGDYHWALNVLQLTAQVQPQNPEVLFDLAEAYYSVGRVPEAKTTMQNALQTGLAFSRTDDARRFLAMADLADQPVMAVAAQAQIEQILKATPDDVPTLLVKAVIAGQKSDETTMEQLYEAVLKQYPDFSPAQKQLAILYAKSPETNDKAYELAVKARKALPRDPEVAKTLGITVYRQGDYMRATGFLQESARERGKDAELIYYLGMAQYHLKNRTEGKALLRRALALNLSGTPADEARETLAELN